MDEDALRQGIAQTNSKAYTELMRQAQKVRYLLWRLGSLPHKKREGLPSLRLSLKGVFPKAK